MKNKKILKRMLALLCATTILVGGMSGFVTESNAASVAETLKAEGYTKIGPEDFGIMHEVVHEGTTNKWYRSSLDTFNMKYFEADLLLNMTTYNQSVFSYWEQYLFRFYVVNGNLTVFSSVLGDTVATASVTSGTYFNLKFATAVSKNESNSANSDITFSMWINDKHIKTNTITVEASRVTGDSAKSLIVNIGTGTETVKIKPAAPEEPANPNLPAELEGYTRITPADYGIQEEVIRTLGKSYTRSNNSYDNTYFEAEIALQKKTSLGSNSIIYMGRYNINIYINTSSRLVIQSQVSGATTAFCNKPMSDLGISLGEYFNIKFATVVETPESGYKKITPQIWINNTKVSNGESITVTDAYVTDVLYVSANTKIKPPVIDCVIKYDDISVYRKNGNYAPTAPDGYIFAGWYSTSECAKEDAISRDCKSGEAYAKFVDKHLLRIQTQITANTTSDSDSTHIRFVTSVDSFNYSRVGFTVMFNGKDYGGSNNKVYETLTALDGNTTWDYTPKQVYGSSAIRFKAWVIRGVTNPYFGDAFTVTPYWETLDGTVVNGATVTKTVNDGITQ